MKRIIAAFAALILLLGSFALAFEGSYSDWNGSSLPENSLCASFDGKSIRLDFDPSAEYSNASDGLVEACFFSLDNSGDYYLEMYLLLPLNASAGDVYTARGGSDLCSVSLYEVNRKSETLYFAGQVAGIPVPADCEFEIRITSASAGADSVSISGTLQAKLCRMENEQSTGQRLVLQDGQFSFTLPLNGSKTPAASPSPAATQTPRNTLEPFAPPIPKESAAPKASPAPRATMDPHPAFTLPPDYRVI